MLMRLASSVTFHLTSQVRRTAARARSMRIMAEEFRAYGVTAYPRARWIARQIRSGVAGISMWLMPNGESASTSALATAGMAPTLPASPAPLTPSGLVWVGTGLLLQWIAERSPARGIA